MKLCVGLLGRQSILITDEPFEGEVGDLARADEDTVVQFCTAVINDDCVLSGWQIPYHKILLEQRILCSRSAGIGGDGPGMMIGQRFQVDFLAVQIGAIGVKQVSCQDAMPW